MDEVIDWNKVLEDVGKRAAETFGRPDLITEDVYRAWKVAHTPLSPDPQLAEFRRLWAEQVANSGQVFRKPVWGKK